MIWPAVSATAECIQATHAPNASPSAIPCLVPPPPPPRPSPQAPCVRGPDCACLFWGPWGSRAPSPARGSLRLPRGPVPVHRRCDASVERPGAGHPPPPPVRIATALPPPATRCARARGGPRRAPHSPQRIPKRRPHDLVVSVTHLRSAATRPPPPPPPPQGLRTPPPRLLRTRMACPPPSAPEAGLASAAVRVRVGQRL